MKKAPSLLFLDQDLDPIVDCDYWTEFYCTRRLQNPGDFALSMPLSRARHFYPQPGGFIYTSGLSGYTGLIAEVTCAEDLIGQGTMTIRGHEAKALLASRVVVPSPPGQKLTLSGPAEQVMIELIRRCCGDIAFPERRFAKLELPLGGSAGKNVYLSCFYSNLLDELCKLGKESDSGFSLDFDAAKRLLVFWYIGGTDRSQGQNISGRALFSGRFDTALETRSTRTSRGTATLAYMLGAAGESGRLVLPVWQGDLPLPAERIEKAFDARAVSDPEILQALGIQKLGALAPSFPIEIDYPPNAPLVEGRDFFLGDLCSVEAQGTWLDARIEGIEEHWDKAGYGMRIWFGNPLPLALKSQRDETTAMWNALQA
jgi:hypothetical protein